MLLAQARLEASTPNPCQPLPVVERAAVQSADRPLKEQLTIASLNIAGQPRIADALAAWTARRDIDVLLLQEVGPTVSEGERFALAMAARLGFHVVFAPAYSTEVYHQGLAIMSRYPLQDVHADLLPYHKLRLRWRCRNALTATIVTTAGPIRTVNVHLDTRINKDDRVAQLAPVVDAIRQLDGPQIVAGDFNSANIGWVGSLIPVPWGRHQVKAVRAALGAKGFETPFGKTRPTFKLLNLPLRLDWIYLKGLSPFEWNVDDVEYSDHRGIWANVKR
jgi:endonuclease/exonuclease/phosphatase family metal-dependent hydrolase